MSRTSPLAFEPTHWRPPENSSLSKNLMSSSYLGASLSQMRRTRSVSGSSDRSPIQGIRPDHIRLPRVLVDDAGATVLGVDLVDDQGPALELELPVPMVAFAVSQRQPGRRSDA